MRHSLGTAFFPRMVVALMGVGLLCPEIAIPEEPPDGPIADELVAADTRTHRLRPVRIRFDLDVDTDRNGCIDDQNDEEGETVFDSKRGATALPNLDDDDGDGFPDHDDERINGPEDRLDLVPLVLRREGYVVRPGDRHVLRVRREAADHWLRVFREGVPIIGPAAGRVEGDFVVWDVPLDHSDRVLELELEIRSYPTAEFDGVVEIIVSTRNFFGDRVDDRVEVRVAPWLMVDALRPAVAVFVSESDSVRELADQLTARLESLGLDPPLPPRPPHGAVFVQDHQEIGFSAVPQRRAAGCFGVPGWHLMLAALQSPAWPFGVLPLGPDLAVVDLGFPRGTEDTFSGLGNLEVTPPLPGSPLGRIYFGGSGSFGTESETNDGDPARRMTPQLIEFLAAQGVQDPLELDTDWLYVAHADESIAFIPDPSATATDQTPFKVLLASPLEAMVELVFSSLLAPADRPLCEGAYGSVTPEALLREAQRNLAWQERIDGTRERMKRELGLAEDDFLDVPVIFSEDARGHASAALPNLVNLLVVDDHLIFPSPCAEGFRRLLVSRLEAIGYAEGRNHHGFTFLDTSELKNRAGELHCTTNTVRLPRPEPWWSIP